MADPRICSVDDCDKPVIALGWCSAHYSRVRRHGSPEKKKRAANGEMTEFLRASVFDAPPTDTCIEWPFAKMKTGYGKLTVDGMRFLAHRYVCTRVHGAPPTEKHQAAHSCGTASCVNPRHLRWATPLENHADKAAHGTKLVGRQLTWTKLSEAQVRAIRRSLAAGDSINRLAREYGLARYTIFAIKSGRNWSWLQ